MAPHISRGGTSPRSATTVLSFAACAVAIVLGPADHVGALSVILGVAAVGAGVLVAGESGGLAVSSSFIVNVLAAAFLGPASAARDRRDRRGGGDATMRTQWRAFLYNNLPPAILPALAAALIVRGLAVSRATTSASIWLSRSPAPPPTSSASRRSRACAGSSSRRRPSSG